MAGAHHLPGEDHLEGGVTGVALLNRRIVTPLPWGARKMGARSNRFRLQFFGESADGISQIRDPIAMGDYKYAPVL